jgi:membrane protease YdiL (CAAX protease family)
MDNATANVWVGGAVLLLWLGSLLTWAWLFAIRRERGVILPYEPRRQVRWGSFAALLIPLYVVALLFMGSNADVPAPEPVKPEAAELLTVLLTMIASQLVITGVVVLVVAAAYRTRLEDFGLPTSLQQFGRDVRIGVVAGLAAILPVHGIQLILLVVFRLHEDPPTHPLVDMIKPGGPNWLLFALASVMAVVVAPLSEEIFFRLLFQGWLEKWEAMRVAWRERLAQHEEVASTELPALENDEARMASDELMTAENSPDHSSLDIRHSTFSPNPPSRGMAGLPYGWFPILISSLIFAAAHFGHGVDPVAIFFLALILGYVYQRTHRIVPTIVTHMLFNSLAILILWQMIFFNGK